jgi:hypothetical protein
MLRLKMEQNNPINAFRIYGLVLEAKDQVFLSVQLAASLEDAFALAKLEYETLNPTKRGLDNPLLGAKIWLFTIKTAKDLLEGNIPIPKMPITLKEQNNTKNTIEEQEIQKEMIKTIKESNGIKFNKNYLMKTIIENSDLRSLQNNKDLLTKNDIKYIEDQIKKKGNSSLDK